MYLVLVEVTSSRPRPIQHFDLFLRPDGVIRIGGAAWGARARRVLTSARGAEYRRRLPCGGTRSASRPRRPVRPGRDVRRNSTEKGCPRPSTPGRGTRGSGPEPRAPTGDAGSARGSGCRKKPASGRLRAILTTVATALVSARLVPRPASSCGRTAGAFWRAPGVGRSQGTGWPRYTGSRWPRSLVPLDEVGGPVWGFVSPLSVSFPTRRYLHVAVNGRVVDTDSFAPAVAKAYADLLPKGKHPAALCASELGPGEVDVNVHSGEERRPLEGWPLRLSPGGRRHPGPPWRRRGRRVGGAGGGGESDSSPIGQFAGRCILAEVGGRADHPRPARGTRAYPLREALKNVRGTPANLPVPAVVRPPVDLAPEVWNFEVELEALGFRVEPFGVARCACSRPRVGGGPRGKAPGALEALAGGEDLAKALACRGLTKFGESLTQEEMVSLLREWSATEFKEICPHGRPIAKRIYLSRICCASSGGSSRPRRPSGSARSQRR